MHFILKNINFACTDSESCWSRDKKPLWSAVESEKKKQTIRTDTVFCLSGWTQQPPAKAGGLNLRTESPDTGHRPVFPQSRKQDISGGGERPYKDCNSSGTAAVSPHAAPAALQTVSGSRHGKTDSFRRKRLPLCKKCFGCNPDSAEGGYSDFPTPDFCDPLKIRTLPSALFRSHSDIQRFSARAEKIISER